MYVCIEFEKSIHVSTPYHHKTVPTHSNARILSACIRALLRQFLCVLVLRNAVDVKRKVLFPRSTSGRLSIFFKSEEQHTYKQ